MVKLHRNLRVIARDPVKVWLVRHRSKCSIHTKSTHIVLNLAKLGTPVEQKLAATATLIFYFDSAHIIRG
jgi:hypothetical protein